VMPNILKTVLTTSLLTAFIWAGDGTLQLSLDSRVDNGRYRQGGASLRLIPEYFTRWGYLASGSVDLDLAGDFRMNLAGTAEDLRHQYTGRVYRAWWRWSTPQLELRFGQQELNFGPARILRSLRWFDARDPLDPLALTQGVSAVTTRFFWLNNANLWAWCIFDFTGERMGIDPYPGAKKSWHWGGRFQYPVASGNLAVTLHHKQLTMTDKPEWRFAVDGQWDVGVGFWFEAVRVTESGPGLVNWQDLITAGGDYTFGLGNGLYALAEYQNQQSAIRDKPIQTVVTRLNYPVNVLDQLFVLTLYNDYFHFSGFYLGWQRAYDYLSWQALAGYIDQNITGFGATPIGLLGRQNLQLTLLYSI